MRFACQLVALTVLGFCLTQSNGALAADTVRLRLHHFNSPLSAGHQKFLVPWAEAVKEASGGQLEIEIFPSLQLGGQQRDLVQQVRDGVVDLAYTSVGYTPGAFPTAEVFELPFVATSNAATAPAIQAFYDRHMQRDFRAFHPLIFHTSVISALHTVGTPVRTPADLAGLKIRTPNRTLGDVFNLMGATTVAVPVPQLYESLQRGVIDGTTTAYAIASALKVTEITRFHTDLPLSSVVFVLLMNNDSYERLAPDLQAAINASSGMAWAKRLGVIWDEDEGPGRAAAEASGEVIEPTAAANAMFEEAARPVIDAWIADMASRGYDGQTLYKDAKELVAEYGR